MAKILVSQAKYAARRKVSRKTVTIWNRSGLLVVTVDGKIDVDASDKLLLASGRPLPVTKGNTSTGASKPGETAEQAADRIVNVEGRAPFSKAEAERIKENYLALLRQLEYDRESGSVVAIADVVQAVVGEYAVVRNKLLSIGSRIAPRAAALKSAVEVKDLVDAEINHALTDLTIDALGPSEISATYAGKPSNKR